MMVRRKGLEEGEEREKRMRKGVQGSTELIKDERRKGWRRERNMIWQEQNSEKKMEL